MKPRATCIGQAATILARTASSGFGFLPDAPPKNFDPRSLAVAKSAVDAMLASDTGFLNPDSTEASAVFEYFAALAASSAVMAAMARELIVRVPFNKAVAAATSNLTATQMTEGRAIPQSRFVLDRRHLTPSTITSLLVADLELLDALGANGTPLLDFMLQQAAGQTADTEFRSLIIDSNVSSFVSAGSTAANALTDVRAALQAVFSSGQPVGRGFWIFSVDAAIKAAAQADTTGEIGPFHNMGVNGGEVTGLPAFVSSSWPAETVTLFDGGQIVGNVDNIGIAASRATAVEMKSSSLIGDATHGTGATMTSVWQSGAIAIKQNLRVGWDRVRDSAAAEITSVAW